MLAALGPSVFAGGEMAERIRSFEWSRTPLGAPGDWSPALRWWGPDYISIYNDGYIPD